MSAFDPTSFMNASVTEASSTQYTPIPEGEFKAVVDKVEAGVVGSENRPVLNVFWKIDDETVRAETGLAEPSIRQTVWLDVTPAGGLDFGKGKNVGLGRLRDAVNQNKAGQPWAPGMLTGQVAVVKVKHSIDKRDNVTIQANVNAVSKL